MSTLTLVVQWICAYDISLIAHAGTQLHLCFFFLMKPFLLFFVVVKWSKTGNTKAFVNIRLIQLINTWRGCSSFPVRDPPPPPLHSLSVSVISKWVTHYYCRTFLLFLQVSYNRTLKSSRCEIKSGSLNEHSPLSDGRGGVLTVSLCAGYRSSQNNNCAAVS